MFCFTLSVTLTALTTAVAFGLATAAALRSKRRACVYSAAKSGYARIVFALPKARSS